MVDRIVVTTAFDRLLDAERDALLGVERSSGIRLEFIAERLGLEGSDVARPPAGSPSASERADVTFAISDAELATMARRPYWKMKRASTWSEPAPAGAVGSGRHAASASWWRSTSDGRSCSGSSDQVLVDDPSISTSCAPWPLRTTPMAAPFRTASACRVSGAALRRTRIDELPQLVNILRGEMSFIGPRPLLAADQATAYAARLLVRPGLTGWAQVKAGRDVSAANKAALDVWYVKNASLRSGSCHPRCTPCACSLPGSASATRRFARPGANCNAPGISGAGEWAAAPRSSLAGPGTERIA